MKEPLELHWENAMFVLIPIMLGTTVIHPQYYSFLQSVLNLKQCVGIIGGKGSSSLFFVGYKREQLILLDPHNVQSAAQSRAELIEGLSSYHCTSPRLLPFSKTEPSLTLAFYFRSLIEFELFESLVSSPVLSIRARTPQFLLYEDSASPLIHINE